MENCIHNHKVALTKFMGWKGDLVRQGLAIAVALAKAFMIQMLRC